MDLRNGTDRSRLDLLKRGGLIFVALARIRGCMQTLTPSTQRLSQMFRINAQCPLKMKTRHEGILRGRKLEQPDMQSLINVHLAWDET